MKKICEVCGTEFEAKRATARYCSGKCRKLAFLSVPEEGVKKEVSVLEDGLSVPGVVSVPDRDNIYSPDYDTSEAGFRRRNKAWNTFQPQFRADTKEACKRINIENVAFMERAEARRQARE